MAWNPRKDLSVQIGERYLVDHEGLLDRRGRPPDGGRPMKWKRWILIAGMAALGACSNPALPKIPQPGDSTSSTKPNTGFVTPVKLPSFLASMTG